MDIEAGQPRQKEGSRWSIASQTSRMIWEWALDSGYRLIRFILCIVFLCVIPAGYSDVRKILVTLADNTVLESKTIDILKKITNETSVNNTRFSE